MIRTVSVLALAGLALGLGALISTAPAGDKKDEKGFVDKSPVLAEARRRIAPFTWHEAKEQHPPSAAEREVWGIVAEWGFRDGFVVPVHAPRG